MGERQKVKLCGKGQDGNVGSQCAQGLPILEMAQRPKELNPSMTSDLLSRLQRSLGLCYSAREKKVAAHRPPSRFTHPSSLLSL